MPNENLDHDALATEEMLKMFEGIEIDDALDTDETETSELVDGLSLDDDNSSALSDEAIPLADELEALPAMELAPTEESERLEMADDFTFSETVENLATLESVDELAGLSFDEGNADSFTQSSDDEFPEADLGDDSLVPITEAETSAVEALDSESLGISDAFEADSLPTPDSTTLTESAPIAEHLQAVVANAIQALQDWMQLRQESEHKGPQQSLAQLDVLLDSVTSQQQQLAEQLAHSPQPQLTQIASALGVPLATPQTLGWSTDDWRVKAQAVADKTDDISQRNAKIREELARL